MSEELSISFFFSFLISISLALNLYLKKETSDEEKPRYHPDLSSTLLPFFLLMVLVLGSLKDGGIFTLEFLLSLCFNVFLHISIYYLVLIAILPFLRKFINARACYMLWLIPNYLHITWQSFMSIQKPAFIVKIPGNTIWILFSIWAGGFFLVFSCNLISHLLFRHHLLKNAKEIRNPDILGYWEQELNYVRIKYRKYKLVTSPSVRTPLSIGLFRRSICVILPRENYTEEEFSLIFRHELIHISREDSWTKFFMVFCCAMCWFNPLMWIAMRKSAEDIELTCDEFVLENMTEEARFKYASLILETAGDHRGFTTCLSSSARSLLYRLKNIAKPKKTYSGAITVGIISFLLIISCGYVTLAYGTYTGADLIYEETDYSLYQFEDIKTKSSPSSSQYDIPNGVLDEKALHQYLMNLNCMHLNCMRLTSNYSLSGNEKELYIHLTTPDKSFLWITLADHHIEILSPKNDLNREIYYLPEPTDWDYLDSILMEYPSMKAHLYQEKEESPHGSHLQSLLYKVYRNDSDIIYQADVSLKEANGTYGSTVMEMKKAELSFTQTPKGPYKIIIESSDGLKRASYLSDNLTEPNTILLPGYDASYIIIADFEDRNGKVYTVEFVFNLGGVIGN